MVKTKNTLIGILIHEERQIGTHWLISVQEHAREK